MSDEETTTNEQTPTEKPVHKCGVVMPISAIADCSASHWGEVREILFDAITTAGFKPTLVSSADDIGVIQKRIVQNLYENPIVVCDVSAQNPNVMFELGLRLAFDKATIIVIDDETPYSLDTGQIEHLSYPRDLRFPKIVEFKETLTARIGATYKAAQETEHSTFLKHFGMFTVPKLDSREVQPMEQLMSEFRELREAFSLAIHRSAKLPGRGQFERYLSDDDDIVIKDILESTLRVAPGESPAPPSTTNRDWHGKG